MGLSANWVCGWLPYSWFSSCWFGFGAQVVIQGLRTHRPLFPWNFLAIYFLYSSLTSSYTHLLVSIVSQCDDPWHILSTPQHPCELIPSFRSQHLHSRILNDAGGKLRPMSEKWLLHYLPNQPLLPTTLRKRKSEKRKMSFKLFNLNVYESNFIETIN